MTEREGKTETIHHQDWSRYLPEGFGEDAPVDQGPHALMDWLDENMPPAVYEKIDTIAESNSAAREVYEDLSVKVSRVLWRCAEYSNRILEIRESESRRQTAQPGKRRHVSVDELRQRQIGVGIALRDLGMAAEKHIIDDLFQRASAVSGEPTTTREIRPGRIAKPEASADYPQEI